MCLDKNHKGFTKPIQRIILLTHLVGRCGMRTKIEDISSSTFDIMPPPHLDGEYIDVVTKSELPVQPFTNKFGSLVLHTLNIELLRKYENKPPRISEYEALVAYRTDTDAPNQSDYPIVQYSNALLTTPRKPNTATNRYFLNPVYEGFSALNVSAKKRPQNGYLGIVKNLLPHTITLEEMADDELVIAKHVSETMGLGLHPDSNKMTHINKGGYSRGVQLSIVQAARAGLHNVIIDRLHGRGPGPINKSNILDMAKSIRKELKSEGAVIAQQLIHDPKHAINNYLNVVTHDGRELIGYVGDASALLQGSVSNAMPHINPELRGYINIFGNDPFGRHEDYVIHFDELQELMEDSSYRSKIAPSFHLVRQKGAHLSGLDKAQVKLDRLEWKAEREYLDGISNTPHTFAG
jgi:hypothetical protein